MGRSREISKLKFFGKALSQIMQIEGAFRQLKMQIWKCYKRIGLLQQPHIAKNRFLNVSTDSFEKRLSIAS